MVTYKLFRESPEITKLKAKIILINENDIVLDKTIFYSFSGGQQSDSGTIGGEEVIASKTVGNDIIYTLENTFKFKIGDFVDIVIDKNKRDKITRLHTAMHIVGDIFEKENILINEIVGSNVEYGKGRLDYVYPENISSILLELQEKVNSFIFKNYEIEHIQEKGDRWLWKCNGFSCPCGGTHVRSTSQIGKIRLKRKNIGKGKERVEVYLDE